MNHVILQILELLQFKALVSVLFDRAKYLCVSNYQFVTLLFSVSFNLSLFLSISLFL